MSATARGRYTVVQSPQLHEGREAQALLPRSAGGDWWHRYTVRMIATDAVAVVVAVAVAYLVRFDVHGTPVVSGAYSPSYLVVSLLLALGWLVALAIGRTRDRRLVGSGPGEYARVFGVSWKMFATVAVVAYVLHLQIGRGYLGFAAPVGVGLILVARYAWRQWLHRHRRRGEFTSGIVVVGSAVQAARMIVELQASPQAGYRVVGACVPGNRRAGDVIAGVPVLGDVTDAARGAELVGASAIAVTGADAVASETVRQLEWDLEGTGIDLALALTLVDVAGPRMVVTPINGLPMVYVDEARFSGRKYVVKSLFDWCVAAVLALVLLPLLAVLALVVSSTSRGPVFFTQERVGKDGQRFRMIKFRSMVDGADAWLGDVLALEGIDQIGPYYKPRSDPRVTRVGQVLRRYSLDELPQLFNVLRGQMSLVGPRPQVPDEVARYDRQASRRLLVKPGMTGLWQVSGRSDLDPEAAVRLDANYVENWTLFGDLLILARTVRVICGGRGT